MTLSRRAFLKMVSACLAAPSLSQTLSARAQLTPPERGDTLVTFASDDFNTNPINIRIPFVVRGAKNTGKIALTYDDGPTPGVTDFILEQLAAHRSKATFFVIGQRVRAFPKLAQTIVEQGHEIANHSYTHPDLSKLQDGAVANEIEKTQKTIEDICGVTPHYFRPPYGAFRATQGALARAQHVQVIIWSIDPQDWRRPGAEIISQRITAPSSGGDIILCHDLHFQTAAASRIFIPHLAKNFSLVTLSNLLRGQHS